jgi:hypothetical protein
MTDEKARQLSAVCALDRSNSVCHPPRKKPHPQSRSLTHQTLIMPNNTQFETKHTQKPRGAHVEFSLHPLIAAPSTMSTPCPFSVDSCAVHGCKTEHSGGVTRVRFPAATRRPSPRNFLGWGQLLHQHVLKRERRRALLGLHRGFDRWLLWLWLWLCRPWGLLRYLGSCPFFRELVSQMPAHSRRVRMGDVQASNKKPY